MNRKKHKGAFETVRRLLKGRRRGDGLSDDGDQDEGSGSGSQGGVGGKSGRGGRSWWNTDPPEGETTSYLSDETRQMDRKRREMEQDGHRQLAKVNARNHEDRPTSSPEGEPQNSIQQHPWLDAQRFDGIDPGLNPEPPLNTEARREFDNERREQEMEKQLRLGNMPKFSSAPKPSPR